MKTKKEKKIKEKKIKKKKTIKELRFIAEFKKRFPRSWKLRLNDPSSVRLVKKVLKEEKEVARLKKLLQEKDQEPLMVRTSKKRSLGHTTHKLYGNKMVVIKH